MVGVDPSVSTGSLNKDVRDYLKNRFGNTGARISIKGGRVIMDYIADRYYFGFRRDRDTKELYFFFRVDLPGNVQINGLLEKVISSCNEIDENHPRIAEPKADKRAEHSFVAECRVKTLNPGNINPFMEDLNDLALKATFVYAQRGRTKH